jgi:hypothetical protein
MPALLGFTALGTEASYWWFQSRAAQGAADAAALSAAAAATAKNNRMLSEAHATAAAQGFAHCVNGVTVTMNSPPSAGTYAGEADAVEVVVTQNQERLFSKLFSNDAVLIAARAVAIEGAAGNACVLALNGNAKGALKGAGTMKATLNGCGLAVNSKNTTALETDGGAIVTADSADIVGGVSGSGLTAAKGINTGTKPTRDPYADVVQHPSLGMRQDEPLGKEHRHPESGRVLQGRQDQRRRSRHTQSWRLLLRRRRSFGRGRSNHRRDGRDAGLHGRRRERLRDRDGQRRCERPYHRADERPLAGIAVFGDRAMPAGSVFTLNGGGTQDFTGAIYLPKAAVTYAGGAKTGKSCTQLVGDTIEFKGNAEFELNCTGTGARDIGTNRPSLVE